MLSALAVLAVVSGAYDPGTVPPEATPRPRSSGRVLHVGRAGLQAAIARARPGDTVLVARRTLRGPVVIRGASKRGVRVIGQGTTIRGSLTVRDSAGVTLRGLSVSGGVTVDRVDRYVVDRVRTTAVAVRGSAGGTITRVRVTGGAGIAIGPTPATQRAVRTFVRDVTVERCTVGIAVDRAWAVTVSRARVLGNDVGVRLTGATDVVVRDNDIQAGRIGIQADGGRSVLIEANRFAGNVTDLNVLNPPQS